MALAAVARSELTNCYTFYLWLGPLPSPHQHTHQYDKHRRCRRLLSQKLRANSLNVSSRAPQPIRYSAIASYMAGGRVGSSPVVSP